MAFWAICKHLAYSPVRYWSRASSISKAGAVRIDKADKMMKGMIRIGFRLRIFPLLRFSLLHLLDLLYIQVSHCKPRYIELATLLEAPIPMLLLYICIDVRINYHYFTDLGSFFPLWSALNTRLCDGLLKACSQVISCKGLDRSGTELESVEIRCIIVFAKVWYVNTSRIG